MTTPYPALIHSARVSAKTREALLDRAQPDDPHYTPQTLTPETLRTLRVILAQILPQDRVDLAQRIDKALTAGETDGWRYAILPPDPQAFHQSLLALATFEAQSFEAQSFEAQSAEAQAAHLTAIAAGHHGEPLQRWFEDLRGQATMLYVSHPSTLARIGYSGIAYAGDPPGPQGFHTLAPGERDAWEPLPQ